jgi:5-methylcytosine-specific restriction protein B
MKERTFMLQDKTAELIRLFREFLPSYLSTIPAQQQVVCYEEVRRKARENFEAVNLADYQEEDVTEQVLLKLLPHRDSPANRQTGAWIFVAPEGGRDAKEWLERLGQKRAAHRKLIAKAVLGFARRCNSEPDQLPTACAEFCEQPYCGGFQGEMLTPILNSLRPDAFLLIHEKSLQVVNYFGNKSYSQSLTDYPSANDTGREIIQRVAQQIVEPGLSKVEEADLFDMFSYWLVAVKKYDFKSAGFTIHAEMYKKWPPMW